MITRKGIAWMSLLVFAAAAELWAAEPGSSRIEKLGRAKQRVAAAATREKGLPRAERDLEARRLGELIDDLEAGKTVDPAEIDRALERAQRLAP